MDERKLEIFTPQGYEEDRPKKMSFKKKSSCDKCGSCCMQSTPSLMKEDIGLFISGILSDENTYTVREGEIIRAVDGTQYEAFMEIIKIREKENSSTCIFYEDGCTIYDKRPFQCRRFNCWETQEIGEGLERSGLKRIDLFSSIDLVIEAIKRHDEKCSFKRLFDALENLNKGDEVAVEDIIDMLQYDISLRQFLKERLALKPYSMDLILGRPLIEAIADFGIKVIKEKDGYTLRPVKEAIR